MTRFFDLLATFGWDQGSTAAAPRRFERMSREAAVEDPGLRLELFASPDSGGAHPRPIEHRSRDGWDLWCLGELWPSHLGAGAGSAIDVFLDGLVAGQPCPETLNGHYLLVARERKSGRVHAWTDRFGTYHAYHAQDGRRAAIGTYFPAVAAAASARRLDWEGITGFLGFGLFPGDRTYYEDVRILRPASHYTFDAEGRLVGQERYWDWRYAPDRTRSYEDTVSEFATIFEKVIREQVGDGPVALPISGGLDSRSTVAPLPAGAIPSGLWSYSYGYATDSIETRIARKIAAARGLSFESMMVRPYLFGRIGDALASVEGFQDLTQCRQVTAVDEIGRHADRVIAAHWGDVWLDDMGLIDAGADLGETDLLEYALKKFRKRGRGWLLDQVCRSRLGGRDPESLLADLVRPELEATRAIGEQDFRIKVLKTDQWSARWTTASLRSYQLGAFPRLPFYDTRLADFFMTVPTEYVAGRRLQIDYLKRYAPDLARITWQAGGANLYRYRSSRYWKLPIRAAAKARRILTGTKVLQRNWEVQFLSEAGRRGLENWLLKPGLRLHEFIAPAEVRKLLDDFTVDPDGARGYTVSLLLTFSTWLELHG